MHIVCQDGSKIQKISFLVSVGTPFFKKKTKKQTNTTILHSPPIFGTHTFSKRSTQSNQNNQNNPSVLNFLNRINALK